jgi:phage pi2 protein 07
VGELDPQNFQQTQNLIRITELNINRETRNFLYTLLCAGIFTKLNKMQHNHLPNTSHCFFENGETEYRYFSEESIDNNWSMDFFIKYVGLSEYIRIHEGTQVIFKHPEYDQALQVDAGGLGDFFSHKFEVSIYDGVL